MGDDVAFVACLKVTCVAPVYNFLLKHAAD